jgi:hypothetical protein
VKAVIFKGKSLVVKLFFTDDGVLEHVFVLKRDSPRISIAGDIDDENSFYTDAILDLVKERLNALNEEAEVIEK